MEVILELLAVEKEIREINIIKGWIFVQTNCWRKIIKVCKFVGFKMKILDYFRNK